MDYVFFSHSWGYRNVFEQFSRAIQQKYPDLIIQGDNYPPTELNAYLAQAISLLKFAIIILLVSGQNPFAWLHIETPSIYTWAIENKVSVQLFTGSLKKVNIPCLSKQFAIFSLWFRFDK